MLVARPLGIVFETLLHEPVLAALRGGQPLLASERPLGLRDLHGEPFILVRQPGAASGLYANLLALCEKQGFTLRVGHEVGRMMMAIELVAAGQGVAIVPASMQGVRAWTHR